MFNGNSRVRSFTTPQVTASPSPPFLAAAVVQTLQHRLASPLQGNDHFHRPDESPPLDFIRWDFVKEKPKRKTKPTDPREHKNVLFPPPPLHPAQPRCSALSPDVPKPSFLPSFMNQYNDHLLTLSS